MEVAILESSIFTQEGMEHSTVDQRSTLISISVNIPKLFVLQILQTSYVGLLHFLNGQNGYRDIQTVLDGHT